jgi:hypothetical protein
VIGVLTYDRADLEKRKNRGEKLNISVVGLLQLREDISPELAASVISSVRVLGIFSASDAVRGALADRIE